MIKHLFHLLTWLLPAALLAGVVGLPFVSTTAPLSTQTPAFGLGDSPHLSEGAASSAPLAQTITSLGAGWVREELPWNLVEPQPGAYRWAFQANGREIDFDRALAAYNQQGVSVLLVLSGGPVYLQTNSGQAVAADAMLAQWKAFVQAAVDRYGSMVDAWQIGDSPNSATGWGRVIYPADPQATAAPDAALYGKMLKEAARIIHRADPESLVLTGALASPYDKNCAVHPYSFLLDLHGARVWDWFDGIALRPNRGNHLPEEILSPAANPQCQPVVAPQADLAGETAAIQQLAKQLKSKPVWITDLQVTLSQANAMSDGRAITDGQMQADVLVRASIPLMSQPGVQAVFWKDFPFADGEGGALQPSSLRAFSNLAHLLSTARFMESQPAQSDSAIRQYRFRNGLNWVIVVWSAVGGDEPRPAVLENVMTGTLSAYTADSEALFSTGGVPVEVDAGGRAILLVTERPVILVGKTRDVTRIIQYGAEDLAASLKEETQKFVHSQAKNAKAELMNWLESLLDSLKARFLNWGEEQLDQVLGMSSWLESIKIDKPFLLKPV